MPQLRPNWPAYKRIPDFVPVPLRTRRDGWTPVRQGEFIGWLAQSGSVAEAAAFVGCSRASAYALRRRPGAEGFAAAWEVAASGGHADASAGKLTRDEVAAVAQTGVVRVLMRRGRYVGTRLMLPVSALLRQLARFDRACAQVDTGGCMVSPAADTFVAFRVNRSAIAAGRLGECGAVCYTPGADVEFCDGLCRL